MIVRDPVVIAVNQPRFLAPGDRSRIAIDVDPCRRPDRRSQPGRVGRRTAIVALRRRRAATLDLVEGRRERFLDAGDRRGASGDGALDVALTLPDGDIAVEEASGCRSRSIAPETRRQERRDPGGQWRPALDLDRDLFADFLPGTGDGDAQRSPARPSSTSPAWCGRSTAIPMAAPSRSPAGRCRCVYLDKTILAAGLSRRRGREEAGRGRHYRAFSPTSRRSAASGSGGPIPAISGSTPMSPTS